MFGGNFDRCATDMPELVDSGNIKHSRLSGSLGVIFAFDGVDWAVQVCQTATSPQIKLFERGDVAGNIRG